MLRGAGDNGFRRLDRCKPALQHFRRDHREEKLILAWGQRRRFARLVDPRNGRLKFGKL